MQLTTDQGESSPWQWNKTAGESLWYMCENNMVTDVTFLINDNAGNSETGVRIRAHKLMLIARSEVFEAMFLGPIAESRDTIEIADCDNPEAFREMLRFIYMDKVQLADESVMAILYLARKYMLPDLTVKCTRYVKQMIRDENACKILEIAIANGEEEIKVCCLHHICMYPQKALSALAFLTLHQNTLSLILDQDSVACDEYFLFTSALKWATKSSGKLISGPALQEQLGDCLRKIQYQNMEQTDIFTRLVVALDVLPPEDVVQFLKHIVLRREYRHSVAQGRTFARQIPPIPQGYKTGRGHYKLMKAVPESANLVANSHIQLTNDYSSGTITIWSSKWVKIHAVSFPIKLDDNDFDTTAISDAPDTVVINGIPSCERIQCRRSKFHAGDTEILVYLVEPPKGGQKHRHNVTVRLRADFKFKPVLREKGFIKDPNVVFNLDWDVENGNNLFNCIVYSAPDIAPGV